MLVCGLGGSAITWALADWTPDAGLVGQTFSIIARLGDCLHDGHPALVLPAGPCRLSISTHRQSPNPKPAKYPHEGRKYIWAAVLVSGMPLCSVVRGAGESSRRQSGAIQEGASLFRANCSPCHGLNAQGGGGDRI